MKCPSRSQTSELGQVFRWSVQLGQLVRWSAQIYPPIIRWHVQMSMSFSDEVFMFCCCIGNMSSCTLSNLCRSLCCCCCCYHFMLLLSCNCPCACATTHEFQQQQQQLYIGIIIIKRWMIQKIWNNFCRCICMLLLCNFLIHHLLLWMHNGRWTIRKTT